MAKDDRFGLRLTLEEREMLEKLSAANGITGSSWIRMMIHKCHRELFGVQPEQPNKAKPSKPKR